MTQEALKLTLEYMNEYYPSYAKQAAHHHKVTTAIKEALAQTEQILGFDVVIDESMPPATFKLAQPEQEPVACVQDLDEVKRKHLVYEKGMDWKDPLYTTPPQRKPMTDEEIDFHLDKILRAAGTALKHYSMQKTKDDMRQALREALV